MTKEEIKQQLQSVFEADYPGIEVFIEKVIRPLFIDDEYIALPARKDILADKDAAILEGSNIESVYLYGEVDTFVPIKVYDITIKDTANIGISRVGIQKFVRQHIAPDSQAFMLFHYRNTEGRSWRFSYLYKEFTQAESTNAKRYTYLFGRDHRARTAVERFSTLAGKAMNDAQPLLDAFSVEKLSDAFFDEYNEHYLDFVQYITGKRNLQVGNKWEDVSVGEPDEDFYGGFNHDDKRVRDYVKKMMGRLVFLCFLQRKGWMGNRDMQYMQNLYRNSSDEVKADFLDSVLEPMFFGLLNTKPEDRADKFRSEGWDIGLITDAEKIPYLNGGLFEQDCDDAEKSVFPCLLFSNPDAQEVEKKYSDSDNYDYSRKRGVLDFFAAYNFTIDENDPDDAEVGVDPEMLSRIFENLLEDNKDKGAFYTPKEIVQYMCRESLIAYLQTDETDEVVKNSIRQFVLTYNSETIGGADSVLAEKIQKALKDVKVCDPAIGSGAFPMGLLNELVHCREVLEKGRKGRGDMKREIIQENIYGVDIEKGAVDIARLRFWLSIVVDEETPHALPNMDFKIMQGNSLLEQYEGVDLSGMSLNEQQKKKTKKGEVYQPSFAFDEDIALENIQKAIKQYYQTESHEAKVTLRKTIDENVKSYILNLKGCTPEIKNKLDNLQIPNNQFFLWHIYFKEVFDKGGFDIVIGNPPYGAKLSEYEKKECKNIYRSAKTASGIKGSSDTFAIFIEQGLKLLRERRPLCFIVPLSVTSSDAMGQLHEIIKNSCDTVIASTYSNRPMQIFESAGLRVSIILCNKTNTRLEHLFTTRVVRRRATDSLSDIVNNLEFVNSIDYMMRGRFPKVGTSYECEILKLIFNTKKNMNSYLSNNGKPIYYRAAGGRYFNVITDYSTHTSAEKSVCVNYTRQIGLCLSSTIFWFYQQVYTDGLNLKSYEIKSFPLPDFTYIPQQVIEQMDELYTKYLQDIESKANIRIASGNSSYNVSQFKEYKIVRSLDLIRLVDDIVCPLYGLNKEQTEYIKNYEIGYRTVGE